MDSDIFVSRSPAFRRNRGGLLAITAGPELQGTIYTDCKFMVRKLLHPNALRRNTGAPEFPLLRDCIRRLWSLQISSSDLIGCCDLCGHPSCGLTHIICECSYMARTFYHRFCARLAPLLLCCLLTGGRTALRIISHIATAAAQEKLITGRDPARAPAG